MDDFEKRVAELHPDGEPPEAPEHTCRHCGQTYALEEALALTERCEHGQTGRRFAERGRCSTLPDGRVVLLLEDRDGAQLALLLDRSSALELCDGLEDGAAKLVERWKRRRR